MQQAGVPAQVATVQNLLHADPRQDPGSSLVQDRSSKGGGKLAIIPGSQLDRTLTALCAKDGEDGSGESAHFSSPGHAQGRPVRTRQIRTLVKVHSFLLVCVLIRMYMFVVMFRGGDGWIAVGDLLSHDWPSSSIFFTLCCCCDL